MAGYLGNSVSADLSANTNSSIILSSDVEHCQSEFSHSFIASGSENRIPSPWFISFLASSTRAKNSSSLISDESALFALCFFFIIQYTI